MKNIPKNYTEIKPYFEKQLELSTTAWLYDNQCPEHAEYMYKERERYMELLIKLDTFSVVIGIQKTINSLIN